MSYTSLIWKLHIKKDGVPASDASLASNLYIKEDGVPMFHASQTSNPHLKRKHSTVDKEA